MQDGVKNIVVLGASGSIGQQTLDVVRKNSDKLKISGLVVNSDEKKLNDAKNEFSVDKTIVVNNEKSIEEANKKIKDLINDNDVDIVVNAIGGSAGLKSSYETLMANKTLALANKESLVVGGEILIPIVEKLKNNEGQIKLLPIDSEHGAIFQCLIGEENNEIYKIHLTASGGPFYGKLTDDLKNITPSEALAHPTWNMGKKISIDSATLMNKGLEVIEAHHLFGVNYDQINVVVQKQSAIHSMVEFMDGSIKAHMGTTDMRIPIQYALSYPQRWETPVQRMNFEDLAKIDFAKPDCETFKCLHLAFEAGKIGGTMPCVMNAANEVAVAKFLAGEIAFLDIANIVENAMENHKSQKVECLDQLKEIDLQARKTTENFCQNL